MFVRVLFDWLAKKYPHINWRAVRTYAAWAIIDIVLILWPLSLFTFAKSEPPFVLSLSWLALLIEAFSLLTASQVHEETGTDE